MAKKKMSPQLEAFLALCDEPEEIDMAGTREALATIFEGVAKIERECVRLDTARQAAAMAERDPRLRDPLSNQRVWGPLLRLMGVIRKAAQESSQHLPTVAEYLSGTEEEVDGEVRRVGGIRQAVGTIYGP